MMPLDKSADNLLMQCDRVREADGLASQSLEPGLERQVVVLKPLREYLSGQMQNSGGTSFVLLLQSSLMISPIWSGESNTNNRRHVSSVRGPRYRMPQLYCKLIALSFKFSTTNHEYAASS